jgi:hypothetical protein
LRLLLLQHFKALFLKEKLLLSQISFSRFMVFKQTQCVTVWIALGALLVTIAAIASYTGECRTWVFKIEFNFTGVSITIATTNTSVRTVAVV